MTGCAKQYALIIRGMLILAGNNVSLCLTEMSTSGVPEYPPRGCNNVRLGGSRMSTSGGSECLPRRCNNVHSLPSKLTLLWERQQTPHMNRCRIRDPQNKQRTLNATAVNFASTHPKDCKFAPISLGYSRFFGTAQKRVVLDMGRVRCECSKAGLQTQPEGNAVCNTSEIRCV